MKSLIAGLVAFMLVFGDAGQARADPVDLTEGYWKVSGEDAAWTWAADLVFESQVPFAPGSEDFDLEGYFDWVGSGGQFGKETFTGRLYSDRAFHLFGQSLTEPYNGISTSSYYGVVTEDGQQIRDGFWPMYGPSEGTWSATHVSVSPEPQGSPTLYSTHTDAREVAFYQVDPATGASTHISDLGVRFAGLAAGSSPDLLYASHDGGLAHLDTSTGEFATVGGPPSEGLAYDRANGKLYGSQHWDFRELSPVDGSIVAKLPTPEAVVAALAYGNGTVYGLVGPGFPGGDLLAYDVAAGSWSLIGPTGLTDMADPGLAFDPDENLLYCTRAGDTSLYAIDPATADTWTIGDTGHDGAGGLAFQRIPEPSTLVLLSMGAVGMVAYALRRRRLFSWSSRSSCA